MFLISFRGVPVHVIPSNTYRGDPEDASVSSSPFPSLVSPRLSPLQLDRLLLLLPLLLFKESFLRSVLTSCPVVVGHRVDGEDEEELVDICHTHTHTHEIVARVSLDVSRMMRERSICDDVKPTHTHVGLVRTILKKEHVHIQFLRPHPLQRTRRTRTLSLHCIIELNWGSTKPVSACSVVV